MKTVFYISLLLALAFGLGNKGCEPADDDSTVEPATPAPEDVAQAAKTGMETAIKSIELAEALATLNQPPQFHPCMVADGNKAGLNIGISNIPAIEAEAASPDGKIHLLGGPVGFGRCMTMAGKPDPWPPVAPNPQAEAAVQAAVPAVWGLVKTLVEPSIPETGQECIEGKIIIAMTDSLTKLTTTTVIDAVNGAPVTEIPDFDLDYSGCGLTFTDTTPAEPTTTAPPADDATPAP